MSSNTLYAEAIRAAEEIRESAEDRVKQNLIESLSPQIKLMVEQKLFEDANPEEKEDEKKPEECGTEYSIESIDETEETTEDITLNNESRRILSKLIKTNMQKSAANDKIESIRESLNSLNRIIILSENSGKIKKESKKINLFFKKIVQEFRILKRNNIVKEDKDLLKNFYTLSKEIENMSNRRYNKEFLSESLEDLLEMNLFEEDGDDDDDQKPEEEEEELQAGEEESEGTDELDLSGLGEDDSAPSQVSAETTVEELAQMAGLMDSAAEGAGDMDMDLGDDSEESVDELDLEGIFEVDEMDLEMDNEGEMEGDYCGTDEIAESFGRRDRVLEIDENMLRREIGRMKAIREGEAKDMASHFGGGSLEGEAFVDGVELNKLHEMKIKAAKVVRMNRMLESKLSQYKKALRGMKGQLLEMNLFNAKLLYANKLMQNRDLSMKQQRHIVESLDEAKTLGEAKILFESLSKTLVSSRKNTRGGNLTEGAIRRRSGSSSVPVKSAQTLNESVALNRWATLAGIKS